MKKILAMLLTMCLIVVSLAACKNDTVVSENSEIPAAVSAETQKDIVDETEGWDEEPAEVTWLMWNVGGVVNEAGVQTVEDAINEITLDQINVKVDLQILEMGAYLSQMPMMVSAGDKIDLISTFPAASGSFLNMVSAGQLNPLDELLAEYAPETLELLPETVLNATTVDDTLYAVPVYTDNTNDVHWVCRKSYLDEIGVTGDEIKNYDDITKVYEKIHELHPDLKLFSSGAQNVFSPGGTLYIDAQKAYDPLGTNYIAVMYDDPTKVVSIFETEEFLQEYEVIRDWNLKGYIDADIMIRQDDPTSDATVFSSFLGGNAQRTAGGYSQMAGEELVSVKLGKGCIGTSTVAIMTMAIPVSATEPEAAAALLNLCYTNKDLKQLVSHGIEGVNYTYDENGGLVQNMESNYAPNTAGIFGNAMLCDPTAQEVAIGYNKADVDQSKLLYSPLLGFTLDLSEISNEAAALDAVYAEYKGVICCGFADESVYKEFIDKLYANGFQVYIDEVQRQVDAFLAE